MSIGENHETLYTTHTKVSLPTSTQRDATSTRTQHNEVVLMIACFYEQQTIEQELEEDMLSDAEACFMQGYLMA